MEARKDDIDLLLGNKSYDQVESRGNKRRIFDSDDSDKKSSAVKSQHDYMIEHIHQNKPAFKKVKDDDSDEDPLEMIRYKVQQAA